MVVTTTIAMNTALIAEKLMLTTSVETTHNSSFWDD
tara:strand:+ start:544 stop:651 length:108 start_codon:yes stop_codon:yes gene_type:complete